MRVVLQRVKASQVCVEDELVAAIGRGLNLLVGIAATDTAAEVEWMARKCLELRLFPDPDKPHSGFELSVREIAGALLVVSQFTLYGDGRKGRRPSFSDAAPPEQGRLLYEAFVDRLAASGLTVATGRFGADMEVQIVNDGPVTLILERDACSD